MEHTFGALRKTKGLALKAPTPEVARAYETCVALFTQAIHDDLQALQHDFTLADLAVGDEADEGEERCE